MKGIIILCTLTVAIFVTEINGGAENNEYGAAETSGIGLPQLEIFSTAGGNTTAAVPAKEVIWKDYTEQTFKENMKTTTLGLDSTTLSSMVEDLDRLDYFSTVEMETAPAIYGEHTETTANVFTNTLDLKSSTEAPIYSTESSSSEESPLTTETLVTMEKLKTSSEVADTVSEAEMFPNAEGALANDWESSTEQQKISTTESEYATVIPSVEAASEISVSTGKLILYSSSTQQPSTLELETTTNQDLFSTVNALTSEQFTTVSVSCTEQASTLKSKICNGAELSSTRDSESTSSTTESSNTATEDSVNTTAIAIEIATEISTNGNSAGFSTEGSASTEEYSTVKVSLTVEPDTTVTNFSTNEALSTTDLKNATFGATSNIGEETSTLEYGTTTEILKIIDTTTVDSKSAAFKPESASEILPSTDKYFTVISDITTIERDTMEESSLLNSGTTTEIFPITEQYSTVFSEIADVTADIKKSSTSESERTTALFSSPEKYSYTAVQDTTKIFPTNEESSTIDVNTKESTTESFPNMGVISTESTVEIPTTITPPVVALEINSEPVGITESTALPQITAQILAIGDETSTIALETTSEISEKYSTLGPNADVLATTEQFIKVEPEISSEAEVITEESSTVNFDVSSTEKSANVELESRKQSSNGNFENTTELLLSSTESSTAEFHSTTVGSTNTEDFSTAGPEMTEEFLSIQSKTKNNAESTATTEVTSTLRASSTNEVNTAEQISSGDVAAKSESIVSSELCISGAEFIPHSIDCTKFIHCSNGLAYVKNCPPQLYWNPELNTCDWSSANCNAQTAPKLNNMQSQCAHGADYLPDADDCSKYIQCAHEQAISKQCPTGLHWHATYKTCVAGSKHCSNRRKKHVKRCNDDRSSYLSYEIDCRKYIICAEGHEIVMQCPTNLFWNPVLQRCDGMTRYCL